MANKLAGQRAKFSRARADYYSSSEESRKARTARLMAEVVAEAAPNGFTEDQVTQGADVPDEVRDLLASSPTPLHGPSDEDPDELVTAVRTKVETADALELGVGRESVYAYGYRCAPDRLKLGSSADDVVSRIASQISTGTPDNPSLLLHIRTHDCRTLERVLHGILKLRGRQAIGGVAEWFVVKRDEVATIYAAIEPLLLGGEDATTPPEREFELGTGTR